MRTASFAWLHLSIKSRGLVWIPLIVGVFVTAAELFDHLQLEHIALVGNQTSRGSEQRCNLYHIECLFNFAAILGSLCWGLSSWIHWKDLILCQQGLLHATAAQPALQPSLDALNRSTIRADIYLTFSEIYMQICASPFEEPWNDSKHEYI